jgi:hypothetical protein
VQAAQQTSSPTDRQQTAPVLLQESRLLNWQQPRGFGSGAPEELRRVTAARPLLQQRVTAAAPARSLSSDFEFRFGKQPVVDVGDSDSC